MLLEKQRSWYFWSTVLCFDVDEGKRAGGCVPEEDARVAQRFEEPEEEPPRAPARRQVRPEGYHLVVSVGRSVGWLVGSFRFVFFGE